MDINESEARAELGNIFDKYEKRLNPRKDKQHWVELHLRILTKEMVTKNSSELWDEEYADKYLIQLRNSY